ncbi:MAG: N5-carboxyaminoimidazole ribonucleotide synthase [Thermonema sp.]|uniref:5-(carboxyamino)imidazole ribonucleotide synthase n=1 Tax=Thermonema sp. TaxID=2231181 RepID=UPI0021DC8741|nr:5-(carboxyamino)imidazole ribonucleotide synthase [Thermonema sp.]GIV39009.1 MAG: N5-carboxyaminoimidazole ribonucleotide synthase [Thermonema sp.]
MKIGILGGGQLGRMLLQAAFNYPVELHVLDPDPQAPCAAATPHFKTGSLQDEATVYAFGKQVEVLTIEIENVNVAALKRLQAEGVKVYPQPHVIETIQDKRLQKQFFVQHQIPTAPFVLIDHPSDLHKHANFLPAFMKVGKGGYDGRGVLPLHSPADFAQAFQAPSLLEKAADIHKEISVIVARNEAGEVRAFPPVEMVFDPQLNLVDYLLSPAQLTEEQAAEAQSIACRLIEALDMVGILAVEMFLNRDGSLWVNEVAPRPHNSGHHTIEANYTSQYEQHLRAITNMPLGCTDSRCAAAMVNLLGEAGHYGAVYYRGLKRALARKGVYVHLYGKAETKPGRKMGHVTLIDDDPDSLQANIRYIKEVLKVESRAAVSGNPQE